MERKNNFIARLVSIESTILTHKNVLRIFVVIILILALAAGLGWEQYSQLSKKYDLLEKRHERLNKIYLQEKGRIAPL